MKNLLNDAKEYGLIIAFMSILIFFVLSVAILTLRLFGLELTP